VPADRADRRKHRRIPLRLPVRVRGRFSDGSVFDEVAACEDAGSGGVSIRLRKPVRRGQVLHLSLPLPPRFRQYDLTDQTYRVYGLVRSVVRIGVEAARVGLRFYGRTSPQGEEALPSTLYLMPGDAGSTGPRPQDGIPLTIRLAAEQAPGGREQEEQTVAECVRKWETRVRITSLPAMKGAVVWVENAGEGFRTRAEVRHIVIGADGSPRLDLTFLDAPAPPSLLTDPKTDDTVCGDSDT
jgi:phage baseplate assembly protein W